MKLFVVSLTFTALSFFAGMSREAQPLNHKTMLEIQGGQMQMFCAHCEGQLPGTITCTDCTFSQIPD